MPESNQRKYRKILGNLDQLGHVIHINRVCEKTYELQVNWQIVKRYRKRDSCNKYILKLHKKVTMSKVKKVAEILEVSIHMILPDHNNPRANWDENTGIELAKSIKLHGLLQPIMIRPVSGIEPLKYVVVYGHRRLWAAKYLKMETIAAQVKEMSDDEAFEFQIIENLQREDVNPMDESFAFQELIKKGLSTPEMIADKIGKSPKYVYDRVILQQVIPHMQAAVRAGQFSITHAKQFARITIEDQTKLWAVISSKNSQEIDPAYIRRLINDTFKLKLGEAIFPTGDSQLVPAAGSCLKCQKHSGCRQLLFEDVKDDDVCFDIECWKKKETAHIDRLIEKYKGEGKEVKLLSHYYYPKDKLLIGREEWGYCKQAFKTNIIGIFTDSPSGSLNEIKKGDFIWLNKSINRKEEPKEEEDSDVVTNVYEGLTTEEKIKSKKDNSLPMTNQDLTELFREKAIKTLSDSYRRGALTVEGTEQFIKYLIHKTVLPPYLLKILCESINWEIIYKEGREDYASTLQHQIDLCGHNIEKMYDLMTVIGITRSLNTSFLTQTEYQSLTDTFPEIGFESAMQEVEEISGTKMFN